MKIFQGILAFIRAVVIIVWTLFSGIFGMLLLLITWSPRATQMITTRWIWSPILLGVCGVKVKLHGKENIDLNIPRVYVANHASQFDIVALCRVMPITLFFVAKKELAKIPVVGWYIYLLGHIYVDRSNAESAKQSMKDAATKIKAGKNVISFAEGTRSKTGELLLFRRGPFIIAKEGNIDVIPIAIEGSHHVLPSGSYTPRSGVINVYIGKAISHKEYQNMTVEELAALARERVKDLLNHRQ